MIELVDTRTMAGMLGVSRQTLERDRFLRPTNPIYPYIRVGERAIRYNPDAVLTALEKMTRKQTV